MDADMIGVMIHGPTTIDAKLRNQVIKDIADTTEDILVNATEDPDLENVFGTFQLDDITREDIVDKVTRTTDDFIQIWNGESHARDLFVRRITVGNESREVLFAGDMSWGDEPEGIGYQTLMGAAALGIHQHFGCE